MNQPPAIIHWARKEPFLHFACKPTEIVSIHVAIRESIPAQDPTDSTIVSEVARITCTGCRSAIKGTWEHIEKQITEQYE